MTIDEVLDQIEPTASTLAGHGDKAVVLSALVAAAARRHDDARSEYNRLLADDDATAAELDIALRAVRTTRIVLDEMSKRQHSAEDHQHVARETFERKVAEFAV